MYCCAMIALLSKRLRREVARVSSAANETRSSSNAQASLLGSVTHITLFGVSASFGVARKPLMCHGATEEVESSKPPLMKPRKGCHPSGLALMAILSMSNAAVPPWPPTTGITWNSSCMLRSVAVKGTSKLVKKLVVLTVASPNALALTEPIEAAKLTPLRRRMNCGLAL